MQEEALVPRKKVVTRFAPNPSWFMHLGHVLSAHFVWGLARILGAQVILRYEDHDTTRSKQVYADAVLEDLSWLGLVPDRVSQQSQHFERYESVLEQLHQTGLVYACSCSRKAIERRQYGRESTHEFPYDNFCRHRELGSQGCGLRLRVDSRTLSFADKRFGTCVQNPAEQCGDLLIRDKNGCFTYTFANVVDDLEEEIDWIIRGDDIFTTTGRQLYLRSLLSERQQPVYFHHPLLLSELAQGQKLSKSNFDHPIRSYRAEGTKASALLGMAAHRIGYIPQPLNLSFEDWVEVLQSRTKVRSWKERFVEDSTKTFEPLQSSVQISQE